MSPTNGVRNWSGFVAYSGLILAVTVVFYFLGFSAYVFVSDAVLITGLALGEHNRRKPNLTANRIAYVVLFASWIGLAVFLTLGWLASEIGLLASAPLPLVAGITMVPGLVIGGAIGDWAGRRRRYELPLW